MFLLLWNILPFTASCFILLRRRLRNIKIAGPSCRLKVVIFYGSVARKWPRDHAKSIFLFVLVPLDMESVFPCVCSCQR